MYRLALLLFLSLMFLLRVQYVLAQSVDVIVFVADIPQFSVDPSEFPASSVDSPTNESEMITFSATALDPESSNYYFIVCKTDDIQSQLGQEPTCPGGIWCSAGINPNGNEASCNYEISPLDVEINDWYAFACSPGTGFCSGSHQGVGDGGSPFVVNHAPEIISIENSGDQDPGGTFVWNVVASDPDTARGRDLVKFFACKSDRFENGTCLDGYWCESEFGLSDLTCEFKTPDTYRDQIKDVYIFVIDSNGLGSSSILQGSKSTVSVNNVPPQIFNIRLNDGNDIDLITSTERLIYTSATIRDRNSCIPQEIVAVTASLYRSSVGYENCSLPQDANFNNCYPQVICTPKDDRICETNEASIDYECFFSLKFYSDPTDSGSLYEEDDWRVSFYAQDEDGTFTIKEVFSGVNVMSLLGIDSDPEISYGSLYAGETISPVSKVIRVFSRANVAMDGVFYGNPMISEFGVQVPVENQRFALSQTPFSQANVLTDKPLYHPLGLGKPVSDMTVFIRTYWGISVAEDIAPGNYAGENYIVGVKKQ